MDSVTLMIYTIPVASTILISLKNNTATALITIPLKETRIRRKALISLKDTPRNTAIKDTGMVIDISVLKSVLYS